MEVMSLVMEAMVRRVVGVMGGALGWREVVPAAKE